MRDRKRQKEREREGKLHDIAEIFYNKAILERKQEEGRRERERKVRRRANLVQCQSYTLQSQ